MTRDNLVTESAGLHRSPLAPNSPRPVRYWFLNPLAWFLLLALKAYQNFIPTHYKPECRYRPSCSQYMALAIRKYGFVGGLRLGLHRLRRCIGFVPGGEDWP